MFRQEIIVAWLATSSCAAPPAMANHDGCADRIDTIRPDAPAQADRGESQ